MNADIVKVHLQLQSNVVFDILREVGSPKPCTPRQKYSNKNWVNDVAEVQVRIAENLLHNLQKKTVDLPRHVRVGIIIEGFTPQRQLGSEWRIRARMYEPELTRCEQETR